MSRPLTHGEDHKNDQTQLLVITGPTAAGKSATAMALAAQTDAVIINADAMQLYWGMDIATAKPTQEEQQRVDHRVIDIWELAHLASVVEYRQLAREAIIAVQNEGRRPLLVGGSILYLRAVVDQLDIPPTDPTIRANYEQRLQQEGAPALHAELAQRDAAAAEHILPTNGRRLVRALEVVELQGYFTAQIPDPEPWQPTTWHFVNCDRTELDKRISRRVDRWWDGGLLAEVSQLLDEGLATAPTASKALGYEQAVAHLAGDLTRAEAIDETVRLTKKLARRQDRALANERKRRPAAGLA